MTTMLPLLIAVVSLALISTTSAVTHKDLLGTWKGYNAGRPDQAIYSRFGLRSFASASEGANGIALFGTFTLADKGDILYCEYAFANFNMSVPQSISLFITLNETTNTVRLHNDTLSIDISYTKQGDLPFNGIYQNTQLPQTALFEGNIFMAVQAPITTSTPPQDGQVYLGAIVYDDKVVNVSECVTTPGAGVPSGTTFTNEPYKFSPGRIDFFNTSFLTSGVSPLSSPIEGVWEAENNGCWMTVEFQASIFRILRTGCGANENTLFLGGAVYGSADQSVVMTYSFAYSYSGKPVPTVMNKVGNFKYQLLASGTQVHLTGTFAQTQPVDVKLQRVSL